MWNYWLNVCLILTDVAKQNIQKIMSVYILTNCLRVHFPIPLPNWLLLAFFMFFPPLCNRWEVASPCFNLCFFKLFFKSLTFSNVFYHLYFFYYELLLLFLKFSFGLLAFSSFVFFLFYSLIFKSLLLIKLALF